jgi:hypothetical protein
MGGSSEQQAIHFLISIYEDRIWYSFHHLSEDVYLGNYEDDEQLLILNRDLSRLVESEETKKDYSETVNMYQNLLIDWRCFSEEQGKDFVQWCANRGRNYPWTESYYYE